MLRDDIDIASFIENSSPAMHGSPLPAASSSRLDIARLALLVAWVAFGVLRFPMVLQQPGQFDEEYFATAGFTTWQEGVPRFPGCLVTQGDTVLTSEHDYVRSMSSCLFIEPPLIYLAEAPFFAALPVRYSTARLPTFLAGFVAIWLVYCLSRRLIEQRWVLGLGLVMFAVSRPLMFTSIIARPDLLCGVFGLLAILTMMRWQSEPKWRWLVIAGSLCGLGLLSHPFSAVYCLQCGVWTLASQGTLTDRLKRASLLTGCSLVVFSLWLPLILAFPTEIEQQFSWNVLDHVGPGIGARFLWPWKSLWNHWDLQSEFNGPYQTGFLVMGTIVGSGFWWRASAEHRRHVILIWTAGYLTAVLAGMHRTKGYWIYPIGLMYPIAVDGVWRVIDSVRQRVLGAERGEKIVSTGLAVGLLVLMLPGAGLRTVVNGLRHWGDERFHADRLIERVLKDLPQEGVFMVDPGHWLDIYASGRKTLLLATRHEWYWGNRAPLADYLVVTRCADISDWKNHYDATLIRREGSSSHEDNYIEIYRVNGTRNPSKGTLESQ